uniref:PIR2-like helical domain-containing protein n=1 Tax=Aegilops tauschii TaxID=37682 RepID=M8BYP0_AEGTA
MGAIPSLAPRLLKAGMPFGAFLDPVSNIIANTVAYAPSPTPGSDEEGPAPEWILSKIITDTSDRFVFELPLCRHRSHGLTLARRSLDGLVNFLTTRFPYLYVREALSYLLLVRADLRAAVRLIERDRNKRRSASSITSRTTMVALECAAVCARHPEPNVLVKASLITASRLSDVTTLLAGQDPLSRTTLESLAELLKQEPASFDDLTNLSLDHLCGKEKKKKNKKRKRSQQTSQSIEGSRPQKRRLGPQLTFRSTLSLKLLLLGKIHGHYLQALAKLPRDGLRKHHHCSLLKGGYCYGPRDPVSNIILNAIWYGSTFPTPQKFELQFKVDMICTRMLARMECCSFYGLVTFLRTCAPTITEHDAIWYLFRSDADVHKAIRKLKKHGHAVCDNYQDAYRQAAVVSWHVDPDALVKFATSSLNMESDKLPAILQGTLTNDAVECLVMALPPTKSKEQAQHLNQVTSSLHVLSKKQKRFISEFQKKFRRDQNFFVKKIKAALSVYSRQKGVGAFASVLRFLASEF